MQKNKKERAAGDASAGGVIRPEEQSSNSLLQLLQSAQKRDRAAT